MSTSRVFTVGQVLTAAQMNDLPQGMLGGTGTATPVGPTSGTTELDVLTAPAVTIAGTNRRIRISFHARGIQGTVTSDGYNLRIKEGATILNEATFSPASALISSIGVDFMTVVTNPSVGAHTYKVTVQRFSGTGAATIDASATGQMNIVVEDIGTV